MDEVGNPTILATFTIIAALLPMGWVSGLMGPYMRPIPVLGSSAMFFSLVAAFVFTPWFALRVRPRHEGAAAGGAARADAAGGGQPFYRPLVVPLIEHRALGIAFLVGIITITALVCTLFYFKVVPVKMLPFDNKPEFSVVVNMPEGTALPETANVVRQLAEQLTRDAGGGCRADLCRHRAAVQLQWHGAPLLSARTGLGRRHAGDARGQGRARPRQS